MWSGPILTQSREFCGGLVVGIPGLESEIPQDLWHSQKDLKKKKKVVLNLNNRIYMAIPSVTTYIQTGITEKSIDEIKHNTK